MERITAKDLRDFECACAYWVERLGLGDWKITVDRGPLSASDNECYAEAQAWPTNRVATIRMAPEWPDGHRTSTKVNEIAFHEVMHIALAPLACIVEDLIPKWMEPLSIGEEHGVIRRLEKAFRVAIGGH